MGRAVLAAGFAGCAALILAAKGAELWGGVAASNGETALRIAQNAKRGPDREKALTSAQDQVSEAIRISGDNPKLWAVYAETRLMQATAGGVRNVSPTLLAAAEAASLKAINLAPNDAQAHARLALAEGLRGDVAYAARELKRSYELDSSSRAIGHRRVEVAGMAWRAVDVDTQRDVESEACMLAAASQADQTRIYNVRMTIAEPAFALALDRVLSDGACKPEVAPAPSAEG